MLMSEFLKMFLCRCFTYFNIIYSVIQIAPWSLCLAYSKSVMSYFVSSRLVLSNNSPNHTELHCCSIGGYGVIFPAIDYLLFCGFC